MTLMKFAIPVDWLIGVFKERNCAGAKITPLDVRGGCI